MILRGIPLAKIGFWIVMGVNMSLVLFVIVAVVAYRLVGPGRTE